MLFALLFAATQADAPWCCARERPRWSCRNTVCRVCTQAKLASSCPAECGWRGSYICLPMLTRRRRGLRIGGVSPGIFLTGAAVDPPGFSLSRAGPRSPVKFTRRRQRSQRLTIFRSKSICVRYISHPPIPPWDHAPPHHAAHVRSRGGMYTPGAPDQTTAERRAQARRLTCPQRPAQRRVAPSGASARSATSSNSSEIFKNTLPTGGQERRPRYSGNAGACSACAIRASSARSSLSNPATNSASER